jgi:hypothetical protein
MVTSSWHLAIIINLLLTTTTALVTPKPHDDTRITQPHLHIQGSYNPLNLLKHLFRRQTTALPPQIVASAAKHDLECKNCPYTTCLNARTIDTDFTLGFSCWTQGTTLAADNTWLRYQYGAAVGDFCYVHPIDLRDPDVTVRSKLPYCGSRSEMEFFLPSATTTTQLATECSLCPFRECEAVESYQAGMAVEVNCVVEDGWEQISPSHANGTR